MTVSPPPSDSDISWAPATIEDAADLAAAFNEVAVADETPERLSSDTMDHELASSYQPLDRRTMVARISTGEVAAYGTVYYRADEGAEHRAHVATYVAPPHRGRGLEDLLVDWVIAAATEELKASTAQRRFVCIGLYKKLEEDAQRFVARGSNQHATGGRWSGCSRTTSPSPARPNSGLPRGPRNSRNQFVWSTMRPLPIIGVTPR